MIAKQPQQHKIDSTHSVTQSPSDQAEYDQEIVDNNMVPDAMRVEPSLDHPTFQLIRRQLIGKVQRTHGNAATQHYIRRLQHNSGIRLTAPDQSETDQLKNQAMRGPNLQHLAVQRILIPSAEAVAGKDSGQAKPLEGIITPSVQRETIVQRYEETISMPFMGTGISPSTAQISSASATVTAVPTGAPDRGYLSFDSGRIETTTLPEGATAGTVQFGMFESVEVNNILINDRQWGTWDGNVPFTVSGDQVTFGSPIVDATSHGSGATASVNVGSGLTPGGGYVTFSLTIASSGSTTQGGSIGVGPISASAPISNTSNLAGGVTRTFTVNLHTTPAHPITGPDVSFRVGSARLEEGQEAAISGWFEALSESDKAAIRNGRRSISISGYASTTGRRGRNRNLSEQRAHVVERILRGHAGSSASLNIFFFGEDNASTPNEREDPTWRRATIVAQAPNNTGPQLPGPAPAGAR